MNSFGCTEQQKIRNPILLQMDLEVWWSAYDFLHGLRLLNLTIVLKVALSALFKEV